MTNRSNIGQTFTARDKSPRECTVTDILRTYNSAIKMVRLRYVATHTFMGQTVTDSDVCETTIAMGAVVPEEI